MTTAGDGATAARWRNRVRERVLLANVLVVAACALVYELLCGTLASYLLGDAVLQFSLVLGTYLFAMGVGAWLSKRFEPAAASRYVQAELVLAAVGGSAVVVLLLAVSAHLPLRPILHGVVFVIGTLVGLELPLLVRILREGRGNGEDGNIDDPVDHVDQLDQLDHLDQYDQPNQPNQLNPSITLQTRQQRADGAATQTAKGAAGQPPAQAEAEATGSPSTPPEPIPEGGRFGETVARAFAFDYLGALAASLLFPLLLVPRLGLVRTAVVTGALNVVAALSATAVVPIRHRTFVRAAGLLILALLGLMFLRGEAWTASATD